jgi:hypothetical protein
MNSNWWMRLRALLMRGRVERDLDDEIRAHPPGLRYVEAGL